MKVDKCSIVRAWLIDCLSYLQLVLAFFSSWFGIIDTRSGLHYDARRDDFLKTQKGEEVTIKSSAFQCLRTPLCYPQAVEIKGS